MEEMKQELVDQAHLREQLKEQENDNLNLKADCELLRGKVERLEMDNQTYKEQSEFRHKQEIRELQSHYESLERALAEVSNHNEELKKTLSQSSKFDPTQLLGGTDRLEVHRSQGSVVKAPSSSDASRTYQYTNSQ